MVKQDIWVLRLLAKVAYKHESYTLINQSNVVSRRFFFWWFNVHVTANSAGRTLLETNFPPLTLNIRPSEHITEATFLL